MTKSTSTKHRSSAPSASKAETTRERGGKSARVRNEEARAKRKAERRMLQALEWCEQWRQAQKRTENPKNRWPGMPPDDLPRFAGNDVGCPTGGMGQLDNTGTEGPKPVRSNLGRMQGK